MRPLLRARAHRVQRVLRVAVAGRRMGAKLRSLQPTGALSTVARTQATEHSSHRCSVATQETDGCQAARDDAPLRP